MNLLNKFAKVKIDNTKTLLKGEDLEYCSKVESDYETAFRYFELEKEFITINNEGNMFLDFNEYLDDVRAKVRKLNEKFIQEIVYHFKKKYKISLEIKDVEDKVFYVPEYRHYDRWKYKDEKLEKKISLAQVIDPISEFLDGMSLDEKADTEIKERFYENFAKLYHHEKSRVELAKNRIDFSSGRFCFESDWSGVKGFKFTYNSEGMVRNFFHGLTLFENGSTEIHSEFMNILSRGYNLDMFSEIAFGLEKIKAIRFYKNGKAVVKFASDELAGEFFRVFCRNGV